MNENTVNCDLCGCQYNQDGICIYDDANIKIGFARACYGVDIEVCVWNNADKCERG